MLSEAPMEIGALEGHGCCHLKDDSVRVQPSQKVDEAGAQCLLKSPEILGNT